MAESEEKGLRARERHRALVRPLVEKYHGEAIEARGDESLSVFSTALDAVNCALAIHEAVAEESELSLHLGIHLGDVVIQDGEISGDGVNIAARICSLSDGDAACVSAEVYQTVRNQPNLDATALGEHELKNVGRPVAVFRVRGQAQSPRTAPLPGTASQPGHEIRSLAVLPLENLSGDKEQEYVADGVTDALIESLARVGPELSVISRTSMMRYKGTTKSSPEIANELGVEYLIEGTVQRQGDRVLIRVQLIEAREDVHRWAESYERDVRDFFSLQREIARAVAGEVEVALTPEREPLLAATRPVDPEALDLYLRAVARRGPSTLVASWGRPAIELLERCVALDPDFAQGWLALANARTLLGLVGLGAGSPDDIAGAQEAAQRAIELDERLGGAHATLGSLRMWHDWDFAGARRACERAVELSPNDPEALNCLRALLMGLGKGSEAELLLNRLERVAPFDVYYRSQRMMHFLYTRQFERGITESERVRELDPEFADFVIGLLYLALDRPEDFVREWLAVLSRGGAAFAAMHAAFQRGIEEGGWQGGLRAMIRLSIQVATQGAFGVEYTIALLSVSIGETEEAMTWLEHAYEERDPLVILAKTDPALDPLRSDPRFQDLLRRIRFPES
jgi:TolB-like protein